MFVVAHFHMVMGVAPIMVVLGAIYHWYLKVTGRMLDDWMGKFHFWVTFLGAYLIFFPCITSGCREFRAGITTLAKRRSSRRTSIRSMPSSPWWP